MASGRHLPFLSDLFCLVYLPIRHNEDCCALTRNRTLLFHYLWRNAMGMPRQGYPKTPGIEVLCPIIEYCVSI